MNIYEYFIKLNLNLEKLIKKIYDFKIYFYFLTKIEKNHF